MLPGALIRLRSDEQFQRVVPKEQGGLPIGSHGEQVLGGVLDQTKGNTGYKLVLQRTTSLLAGLTINFLPDHLLGSSYQQWCL